MLKTGTKSTNKQLAKASSVSIAAMTQNKQKKIISGILREVAAIAETITQNPVFTAKQKVAMLTATLNALNEAHAGMVFTGLYIYTNSKALII